MKVGEIWKLKESTIKEIRRMFEEDGELDNFNEDSENRRFQILEFNEAHVKYTELNHPIPDNEVGLPLDMFLEDYEKDYENRMRELGKSNTEIGKEFNIHPI